MDPYQTPYLHKMEYQQQRIQRLLERKAEQQRLQRLRHALEKKLASCAPLQSPDGTSVRPRN